jgi:hypothetical protein
MPDLKGDSRRCTVEPFANIPRLVHTFTLAVIGALLLASPVAWGQAATGRAFGTVTDQQHAAVPGASVTVTNEAWRHLTF